MILSPLIAWLSKGKYYIARTNQLHKSAELSYICQICDNKYEQEDMAYCPLHEVNICSLCCSLDSLCHDTCKKESEHSLRERIGYRINQLFGNHLSHKASLIIFDFIWLTSILLFIVAIIAWTVYSLQIEHMEQTSILYLKDALIAFYLIISVLISTFVWWVLLLQESRRLAEEELEEQNEILKESQHTILFQKKAAEYHKERLELALMGSHAGIMDWNLANYSVYYSPQWKEILGYSDDELANKFSTWVSRVHPDDLQSAMSAIYKNIASKAEFFETIHRLKHKDGQWKWILGRAKIQYDKNGKAIRVIGTQTDITDEKIQQLKDAHQTQIIEQTHDSVISTDLNGIILSWNCGSEHLLDYQADEAIGQHITMIYLQEDFASLNKNIESLIQNGDHHTTVRLVKKSKEIVDADLSLSLLKDENGKPIGMVCYSQDITERKKAEQELLKQKAILDHQAHHDALTGLPNRVLFNDRLYQAIELAKRHKTELAVFFIDLDRFKQINDSLGHELGDKVLQQISARLRSAIRKEDSLARLGGDEFTILMEDLTKGQNASLLAQKILLSIAQPLYIDDHTLYVSSSIGISLYPQDDTNIHKLLMYADAAMYKAKDEGRNNFQFYSSEMTALALEKVTMEAKLRNALKKEQFIVYYQPQVNGKNNQLQGMEALVRWQHPEIGLIAPAKFIPIAEETGLITPIHQWVMKTAMKQVVQWYKEGFKPGKLALNLAMKQLHRKDFVNILKEMLIETEFKAQWLELEITEGQIMTHPENAISVLKQISEMGIELAVDDFGTGYSSLSYLKRLPIDKLKIDKSFVKDLPDNEEDAGINKAIIALAESLNLSVIAEGVETKEQKDFLVNNGCKYIQGYFYGRPMPADKIKLILTKGLPPEH